jgi:hypothetical protein
MPIEYNVVKNNLTTPPSWTCTPTPLDVLSFKDIAENIHITDPTITVSMAATVLREFGTIVRLQLLRGNNVTLEKFISFRLSLQGRFPSVSFHISSARLDIQGVFETSFKKEIKDIATYSRNEYSLKSPVINSVQDSNTEYVGWIRNGGGFLLFGSNLKFDSSLSDEGVYLVTPSGFVIKQDNLSLNLNSIIAIVGDLGTNLGPAGTASVEHQIAVKTRYTTGGTLRIGSYSGKLRSTNVISDTTSKQLFVSGSSVTGPANVREYSGTSLPARIVSRIDSGQQLFLSGSEDGDSFGAEVFVSSEGTFSFDNLSLIQINVTDYATLYNNTLDYAKYFTDFVDLNPITYSLIDSSTRLVVLGPSVGTGDIWADTCSNTQVVAISNNRFVWIGYSPLRDTQTIIGSVSDEGVVIFGPLVDLQFLPNSFQHNTFGVMYFGGNLFGRYHEDLSAGIAVWDCGANGLNASMVNSNNGSVTCIPSGYLNGILFNEDRISIIDESFSICTYSFISDTVAGETELSTEIFGVNRVLATGDFINGCSAPGGVLYVAKTSDLDLSSNSKMELMYCNTVTGTVVLAQCSDLDGEPICISCQSDGTFVFAYTVDGTNELRFRCGTLIAESFSFGDSFDFNQSEVGINVFSGSSLSLGNLNFVFCIQQQDSTPFAGQYQASFGIYSDGSSIYTLDDQGRSQGQRIGGPPVGTFVTDISEIVCIANYGHLGISDYPLPESRYITPFEFRPLRYFNLLSGVGFPVSGSSDFDYFFYFRVKVPSGASNLSISFSDNSEDVALYVTESHWPSDNSFDCETYSFDDPCVFASPSSGFWYILATSYGPGSFTVTATII